MRAASKGTFHYHASGQLGDFLLSIIHEMEGVAGISGNSHENKNVLYTLTHKHCNLRKMNKGFYSQIYALSSR